MSLDVFLSFSRCPKHQKTPPFDFGAPVAYFGNSPPGRSGTIADRGISWTRCSREREMPCLTSEYKLNPWGGEGATRAREVSYNDEGNRVGSNQQRCNLKHING